MSDSSPPRHPGGRPAKFNEPSRSVTMTLPVRVLDLLDTVSSDRARAVVKLAETFLAPADRHFPPIDVLRLPDGKRLLLVADSPALRALPWLDLIEISPGRNLICLHNNTRIEQLEIALVDLLDTLPPDNRERPFVAELLDRLRRPRRAKSINKGELIIIAEPEQWDNENGLKTS